MGAEQVRHRHGAEFRGGPVEGGRIGLEEVEAARAACTRVSRTFWRAYSRVLMMPAWPQPETSTKPFSVSSTERHVFGNVVLDLTAVRVSDRALQAPVPFGIVRGTGPVSQAPGNSSVGRSMTTNDPPSASNSFLSAIASLVSRPSGPGRLRMRRWKCPRQTQ